MMGTFIVFEGGDRSGKTTQVQLLERALTERGHRVRTLCFPNRNTSTGRVIDDYLKGGCALEPHAVHLLFSANRWETAPDLVGALKSGEVVICDRYVYSGFVYSSINPELSRDLEWVKRPDVGLPKPDLVVLLGNTDPTAPHSLESTQRNGFGREVYETSEIQSRIHRAYAQLFKDAQSDSDASKWISLDMTLPIEDVHAAVVTETLLIIEHAQNFVENL